MAAGVKPVGIGDCQLHLVFLLRCLLAKGKRRSSMAIVLFARAKGSSLLRYSPGAKPSIPS